jgi:hypothetical protein
LVQEQLATVRDLLDHEDRALEHAHANDVRYQLRLLFALQQTEQRRASVARNLPNVNWP